MDFIAFASQTHNAELTGAPFLRVRVERLVGLLEFY